jgi:hypothetical protein
LSNKRCVSDVQVMWTKRKIRFVSGRSFGCFVGCSFGCFVGCSFIGGFVCVNIRR